MDHDLDLNEGSGESPEEDRTFIRFPEGDRLFPGTPFIRIPAAEGTGETTPREAINEISHFIDGGNGYGNDNERAAAKRTTLGLSFFGIETGATPPPPEGAALFDGKLITSNSPYNTLGQFHADGAAIDPFNTSGEDLLPYNRALSPNASGGVLGDGPDQIPVERSFISGDLRANEQVGLTAIHNLFVREHNVLVDEIAEALDNQTSPKLVELFNAYKDLVREEIAPDASDEAIRGEFLYEAARSVISAKQQVITYQEFLPLLVGDAVGSESTYNPEIDPSVSTEFANAAYRLGHTLLNNQLLQIDSNGFQEQLPLANAFFNPDFVSQNGVDNLLTGLIYQKSEDVDNLIVDGVRDFLFPAGTGGLDLAVVNIARGRDVGIPGYVEIYNQLFPATPITSFDNLPFREGVVDLFKQAYPFDDDPNTAIPSEEEALNQIDLWIAGISETSAPDQLLGPTFSAIVADQFTRSRDGDRFFYSNDEQGLGNPGSVLSIVTDAIGLDIKAITLSDVLQGNVDDPSLIPDDAFMVPFDNQVFGDDNDNVLQGTELRDLIDGQGGNDSIAGLEGDDILFGGSGNDVIEGGAGNDIIVGGVGNDIIVGGVGNDTYVFGSELLDGIPDVDAIEDFQSIDSFDFEGYLGAGGTVEFERVDPSFLQIKLNNEDLVNVLGDIDAAENQLNALSA